MFVPCDLDGNVLEEPSINKTDYLYHTKEYEEAKDRVLFEGFQLLFNEDGISHVKTSRVFIGIGHLKGLHKTIEDLVEYNLELTPTAQKQIGL